VAFGSTLQYCRQYSQQTAFRNFNKEEGLAVGGAWYALATIAVALVIRWVIQGDAAVPGRKSGGAFRQPKIGPNPDQD
jgi:hypothetical protein